MTLESQLRASLSAARGPDAVVLSREQLPSDEELEVTQAQLAMLVMRVNQQLKEKHYA